MILGDKLAVPALSCLYRVCAVFETVTVSKTMACIPEGKRLSNTAVALTLLGV